jgi:preprotein translocase subunit SecG
MITVLLTIHVLIAATLVTVILMQKSTGDAIGAASAGLMSGRSSGNVLTRATAILATVFFVTSILLAILAGHHGRPTSILNLKPVNNAPTAPVKSGVTRQPQAPRRSTPQSSAPAPVVPAKPAAPSGPSVPLAK